MTEIELGISKFGLFSNFAFSSRLPGSVERRSRAKNFLFRPLSPRIELPSFRRACSRALSLEVTRRSTDPKLSLFGRILRRSLSSARCWRRYSFVLLSIRNELVTKNVAEDIVGIFCRW